MVELNDAAIIANAEKLLGQQRYMAAANLLQTVQNNALLSMKLRHVLTIADELEILLRDELSDSGPSKGHGWKKQCESHANYDIGIYYKVDENHLLTVRIDFILESSLLLPMLAVMNETDLFSDWMPTWKHPRVGLQRSMRMHEISRADKIIMVTVDMPFPFKARECVQRVIAIDAIDENSAILLYMKDIPSGFYEEGIDIPKPEKGIVRVDLESKMIIRACPNNHALLKKSKKQYPEGEHKLLFTIEDQIDAHVSSVPLSVNNFFMRKVIKQNMINLVRISADVRSGKREKHLKAIQANPELYGWIEQRVEALFSKLN